MKHLSIFGAAACSAAILLQACGGGGGGSSTNQTPLVPPVAVSPNPGGGNNPPPTTQGNACPSTGPSATSVGTGSSAESIVRGPVSSSGAVQYVPGVYTVTYASDADADNIETGASAIGVRLMSAVHLSALGLHMRTYAIDSSHAAAAIAKLKASPGVIRVEQAQYRHLEAVTANDPYYVGFNEGPPYYEAPSVPGQWDMHVINVAGAWSQYSTVPVRGAAIAVIDTGVDVSHPEMSGGKVVRQACFVTYPAGSSQSTSPYAVDMDGHGTNVAGISDSDTNNSFAFAGVAYDAPLLAYRIFPSPPSGGCIGANSAQCETTDVDEASAINDAVANHARVINLSLGATCSAPDSIELNAVEAAIKAGVVVVAAAGNDGKPALDCPASYPGVIAVGAEGPGGSSDVEQVAGYSNYITSRGTGNGGAYLVAPGGVANSSSDSDDLHYVENITSSQMPDAGPFCGTDHAGESNDCRGSFSGTSQATPHVTGVASLILGLRPSLTPAQVASAICSSAHSIGDSRQGCGRLDASAAVTAALRL